MDPAPRLRGRGREFAVLAAGLCASVALVWAGATVHEGLATAGEVAVARLSSAVEETVKAEWQRMLRASEMPVEPAGEVFGWFSDQLEPLALVEHGSAAAEASVFETLLAEAERRELVEDDPGGALELVLEALTKEPDVPRLAEGRLRALQLGVRLRRTEVVEPQWDALCALALSEAREGIPYRLLAALAVLGPPGSRPALPPHAEGSEPGWSPTPGELERLFLDQDRLTVGSPEAPDARFELAPMLVVLCSHLGLEPPSPARRKAYALARLGTPPELVQDGRWHFATLAGRPFVARCVGGSMNTGAFYEPRSLQRALIEHAALSGGFQLDFAGDADELGTAVRPRTTLPESALGFTLRHRDPASLGQAEASRLKLLRGALFALALACAAGGVLTARLLARQRKLAALKSAFVAGVSHDLRTPLSAILLLTENLESGAAGADPSRTHQALRKEATRLRRLVDDVLDFSRMERGQTTRIEREDVELGAFLDELAAEFGARVEAAGRAFEFRRGELPASANLDAHAVRRALENLLDNALKHGAGAVRLGCAAADGHLCFTVADDGPGVPAAERERAFEPFERLGATNGHVGGTGLGLAIVRAIARGHGGEARIRADGAGAGSVFELDLPLEETEETA